MEILHLIVYSFAPKVIGHERSNCDEEGGEIVERFNGGVGFSIPRLLIDM